MSLTDPPPDTLEFGDPRPADPSGDGTSSSGSPPWPCWPRRQPVWRWPLTPAPRHRAAARRPQRRAGERNLGHGGGPRHARWPREFGIAGPMGALHGEFVVPKQGGGYQTLVVQRGKVTLGLVVDHHREER